MDKTRIGRIGELFYDPVSAPFGGKSSLTSLVLQARQHCEEQEKIPLPGRKWTYTFSGESSDTFFRLGIFPVRGKLDFDFISVQSGARDADTLNSLLDLALTSCRGRLSVQYNSVRYADLSQKAQEEFSEMDKTEPVRRAEQWKVYVNESKGEEYLIQAVPIETATITKWEGWKRKRKEIEKSRPVENVRNDELTKELLTKSTLIEIRDRYTTDEQKNKVEGLVNQDLRIQQGNWNLTFSSTAGGLPKSAYTTFESFFKLTQDQFNGKTQYRMQAEVRTR